MILTPGGWVQGSVRFTAAIQSIEPGDAPPDRFILPGFVDLHVHGGGGADVMTGADGVRGMAAFHARHGTTALLATTVTAPEADLRAAAAGVAEAMRRPADRGARVVGWHLEGPFINPGALGAQPAFAIPPDLTLAAEWCALAPMRVATIAPEMDPDGGLLSFLTDQNVRVQIGHTLCSYAEARQALDRGAAGFTHLFNAMTGLHHRAPGAVGCALAVGTHAEIIADLFHVEQPALLIALRTIPGLYAVTDAVAAAGMPDGTYTLGRNRVEKMGEVVRLADGGLAGSVLTMDRALRNLMGAGLTMAAASARVSTVAAAYLGLTDRGVLVPGAAADMVVVDGAGHVMGVVAEGVVIG